MNLSLVGKRALVCGSTAGIGRAAAVELAQLGASVTLLARNPEKLKATMASLPSVSDIQRHHWAAADFDQLASVREAIRTLVHPESEGGPHVPGFAILVNNTGGPPGGALMEASPEAFLSAFNAHIIVSQLLTQALVPAMKASRFGRIINIISTSVKAPIPGLGVSNTIRGAAASWSKTLAGELGQYGITVNNILPGYTKTDRLTTLVGAKASKQGVAREEIEREILAGIPAGRFAEAEEIGAAVAFLASPAGGYINGINLPIDGGRLQSL